MTTTSTVEGTIFDASDQPLAWAEVKLTTAETSSTTVARAGKFHFAGVPPGKATIRASLREQPLRAFHETTIDVPKKGGTVKAVVRERKGCRLNVRVFLND